MALIRFSHRPRFFKGAKKFAARMHALACASPPPWQHLFFRRVLSPCFPKALCCPAPLVTPHIHTLLFAHTPHTCKLVGPWKPNPKHRARRFLSEPPLIFRLLPKSKTQKNGARESNGKATPLFTLNTHTPTRALPPLDGCFCQATYLHHIRPFFLPCPVPFNAENCPPCSLVVRVCTCLTHARLHPQTIIRHKKTAARPLAHLSRTAAGPP
jgi:hypothetical protein